MKLAIISRGFLPDIISGRETAIYNLWKIAKQHYEVSLICGWEKAPNLLPEHCYKIDQSSNKKVLNYLKFYLGCRKYLKKIKPDLILTNNLEIPKTSIPTIVIVYDFNFGNAVDSQNNYLLKKLVISHKLNKVDKIIAISSSTKKKIIELGIHSEKVGTIHVGVDSKKFFPKNSLKQEFTISYPSRIFYGKGQHIAINAIKLLPHEIRNKLRLKITGFVNDNQYFKDIRELAKGLPVDFTTNVPDLAPYYQQADIVIFSTIMEEGFGYTAIEAMSCQKPVIYSDFPAIIESTGNIGIKFRRGVASELAENIVKLYLEKERRSKIGEEGRNYVLKHYSWNNIFIKYKKIFDDFRVNEKN